uniref:SUN domain-containing protein n=1 Tax=Haemonchus placei TaxID=6290 RepID=A0A158QP34_HAEPC
LLFHSFLFGSEFAFIRSNAPHFVPHKLYGVFRHPPSTLATETSENDSTIQKTTEEAHQPIVTFDEWTKEKLKQEHRKPPTPTSETGTPSVRATQLPPGAAATRNYASKECGAKVLLSNPEAENTKAILNEKEKDEYMRNPCEKAENKFVILELCETVQPRSIELANYELFSSGPRDIRLWAAERFPAGEWKLLTELTAVDSRQIQQFPIPNNGAYVKFMKVELISHYGNEHYCTLSVLKILGISMVDEYEAEVIFDGVSSFNVKKYESCLYFRFFIETISPKPAEANRRGQLVASRSRRGRFAYLHRRSLKRLRGTGVPDKQPNARSQPVPSDAWPASSTSHKVRFFVCFDVSVFSAQIPIYYSYSSPIQESVFMKLNKRIAALELNMSLSSEYLSELSRQYVAQTDEHQKHLKQARKVVDEAVETIYARVNETLADKVSVSHFTILFTVTFLSREIAALRKEVDTLSGWLTSMRATASKMTVRRYARGAERMDEDKCILKHTDLHRYSPPDDGLWTVSDSAKFSLFRKFVIFMLFITD